MNCCPVPGMKPHARAWAHPDIHIGGRICWAAPGDAAGIHAGGYFASPATEDVDVRQAESLGKRFNWCVHQQAEPPPDQRSRPPMALLTRVPGKSLTQSMKTNSRVTSGREDPFCYSRMTRLSFQRLAASESWLVSRAFNGGQA